MTRYDLPTRYTTTNCTHKHHSKAAAEKCVRKNGGEVVGIYTDEMIYRAGRAGHCVYGVVEGEDLCGRMTLKVVCENLYFHRREYDAVLVPYGNTLAIERKRLSDWADRALARHRYIYG